ncbi:MAG: methionyl-tRNA formyltransferase [Rubrobacter sp.]|nr:methionyl-tRNA formyltransferase [Rubrobacter sp.]
MKVAFAGTPDFAATILHGLLDSKHDVGLVVSQPDSRRGRGRKTIPPPVAELAREADIPLLQPERISEATDAISVHDALVVAAYGQILRPDTLYAARLDSWNVHASLLPKYRGAAPIERAIMDGEKESGVTIMKMDEGLDTGDIALRKTTPIPPDMNAGELTEALASLGAEAMIEVLGLLEDAKLTLIRQDSLKATYASKVSGEDQALDFGSSAGEVHNVVRALSPRIGARAYNEGFDGPIKVWRTRVAEGRDAELRSGEISVENGGIFVGCGDGVVEVLELQTPGGKRLSAREFLRGNEIGGSLRGGE